MRRITVSLLFTIIPFSFLFSQLEIQGELRPRAEYRSGYKNILTQNQEDAFFISQRTRLSLYYSLPKIRFGFSIQDVRVWGDEGLYSSTGIFGDDASLDLNEAWMEINLYRHGSLKIGRQFWKYEDERILSPRSWNQSQVKYDALTFRHASNGLRFDLGLSWNSMKENVSGNEYPCDKMKTINFAYFSKEVIPWLSMSGLAILSGFTQTDSTSGLNMLATYFGYIHIEKADLTALLSGSYQHGNSRDGKETRAWMFSARAEYALSNVSVGAGIDCLSGNDGSRQDPSYTQCEHSYDILYGARHKYYGHMDFFSSLQKATGSGGLVDAFFKFTWIFLPKASFNTDFHYFSLQNHVKVQDYSGTGDQYYRKPLGPEADIHFSWDILDILNLKAGYSIMFPTETMSGLQGIEESRAKTPQWAWVMITARPMLLGTSKK